MSKRAKFTMGRAGVCNVCFRSCITLDQVGIRCFHCGEGEFIHRSFWDQWECICRGAPGCSICGGAGFIAKPREDCREWPAFRQTFDAPAVLPTR